MKQIKVVITGVTGMIGEGVLYECLNNQNIEKVLVLSRKPCGYGHSKLVEVLHDNLADVSGLKHALSGYDACFFCIGTTAIGKTEAQYTEITYDLTMKFATQMAELNPHMTFCYISGVGTDSSEKGKTMWARVKGKTENDLMKLPFAHVYNFRPAGLLPFLPLKPSQTYYKAYKWTKWLMLILKPFMPNYIMNLRVFATAMINSAFLGYQKNILEPKDIRILGSRKIE